MPIISSSVLYFSFSYPQLPPFHHFQSPIHRSASRCPKNRLQPKAIVQQQIWNKPGMTENFDMSRQESAVETEPNLSELKKEVEITPSTLKDITNKEEFLQRVIELSNNAKDSINIERAKEALVYLAEAEKILEYAASCGKPIDKYIIVGVLHNEACCYQKIWQLQKCSQYLQALIFNFNSFLKSNEPNRNYYEDSSTNKGKQPKRNDDKIVPDSIDCKTFLAKYYLQFCAVNSQTDNHNGALVAGRKSIEILKSIFGELADLLPTLKKGTYQKKSEFEYKVKLIELGARINDNLNVTNYDTVFQAAKYHLKQWKALKDNKDRTDRNYVLQEEFKNYSIGNAMQIVPMDSKEFQERDTKNYSAKAILEKILLMALGYFTISTELRLIATKKYKDREGDKANSTEYRQSQIYHLLSVIIASSCIPFQILYIKHVLSSYSNHYGSDLFISDQQSKIRQNQFEQLIFPALPSCRQFKATNNNSFNGSLDQEETVSKFQKEQTEHQSSSNEMFTDRKKLQSSKDEDNPRNDLAKKIKLSHKNKSKSKSKQHFRSINMMGGIVNDKSEKASPMPKSPGIHMKSPKSNLIKVKTSYKLKVSAEKIVTTNNIVKEDKSKKRKEIRPDSGEFDYFMGRSKDLKRLKKTVETGLNMPSPRPNHTSRSSSKRQSPIPKYFQHMKLQQTSCKNLKSPKKSTGMKTVKNNLQQHYL